MEKTWNKIVTKAKKRFFYSLDNLACTKRLKFGKLLAGSFYRVYDWIFSSSFFVFIILLGQI